MKSSFVFVVLLVAAGACGQQVRWKAEANSVTITRDDWGIAHVHGKTDADAVFGMIYAQCEDDFNRVEMNYLTSLGRTAEAEGDKALYADLRQRLFIDEVELRTMYAGSPQWLQQLMTAWADGVNFFLAKHSEVRPKVIKVWEPWMALSFTEGSIGGDIERVDLKALAQMYPGPQPVQLARLQSAVPEWEKEPGGSNGIAIAPALTVNHHALLLINPHTSFFFRSELQMTSDEGLNAYGAATWGQFFVYQGFNDKAGWMHTSSGVDAVDEFRDTPVKKKTGVSYLVGGVAKSYKEKTIVVCVKQGEHCENRSFHVYFSHRGPVVRKDGTAWISIELMNKPVAALEQSYLRTKARNYAEYRRTMELQANSSNNTIFADADGDIAYWHGNFIPRRDAKFDYTKPVDGSNPSADWQRLMTVDETPQLKNPKSGWLFNVNDSPWNGAGESSLKKSDFPAYVERGIESARGVHAMRVLTGKSDWTIESLRQAAYDSYLPWFARTLPRLLAAWDALPSAAAVRTTYTQAMIADLRAWDYRWSAQSKATTVAVFWGTEMLRVVGAAARVAAMPSEDYVAQQATTPQMMDALQAASAKLVAFDGGNLADIGTPRDRSSIPAWGEVNRFQRLDGEIVQPFNDAGPSAPVPFPSALWGSLASFGARPYPSTKKWYGTSGNSFVAVVEFGDKVHAVAVTAGGESGHPQSKHFDDEVSRYARGGLREVYFYPEQLQGHTEKVYRPGE